MVGSLLTRQDALVGAGPFSCSASFSELMEKPDWLDMARFVEVRDRQYVERRDYIELALGSVAFHKLSSVNLRGLSQNDSSYDILLVSADDVIRLRSIFLSPSDIIIKRKLSFVLCSKANPKARSKLFRMGFDDVFTCDMSFEEISLRISAHHRRRSLYTSIKNASLSTEFSEFCKIHLTENIKGSQQILLYRLFNALGRTVSVKDLATYDLFEERHRTSSVPVMISHIRKMLISCSINSDRGNGYYLQLD